MSEHKVQLTNQNQKPQQKKLHELNLPSGKMAAFELREMWSTGNALFLSVLWFLDDTVSFWDFVAHFHQKYVFGQLCLSHFVVIVAGFLNLCLPALCF